MITKNYVLFWGHKKKDLADINESCFSQWFPSVVPVSPEDFPGFDLHIWGNGKPDQVETAEHFMMLAKCYVHNDYISFVEVLRSSSPEVVKKIGRGIRNYNDELWTGERYNWVLKGNIKKFKNNPTMKDFLLSTEDKVLVEASPFDKVWGIGLGQDDPDARNPSKWKGQNLLGKVLMETREILRKENQ